tara:strand:- start:405 stop:644 length:240 start_codon:yes stop_codon:yes gene_type:complete
MLDNKLLNKVVDQIMSETKIINDKIYAPFLSFSFSFFSHHLPSLYLHSSFSDHCKNVYSLKNDQEIEYVWKKYKKELIH